MNAEEIISKMKNAQEISIDLEYGFAYAHDGDDNNNLLQVCLMQRKDGKGFKKAIDTRDCGYNEGICGDYNGDVNAADLDDFFSLARKFGIRVI